MVQQATNIFHEVIVSEGEELVLCDQFFGVTWKKSISLKKNAKLTYVALLSQTCDIEVEIHSSEEWSQLVCHVLAVASADASITLQAKSLLEASHTQVDMHLLTFLTTGGRSWVDGTIVLGPWIIKASWHLLEENIILGENVQLKTLPMLDVRSNDVSASHGARIEKLDEKKLFYLESKGIPPSDAKRLMVEGYIEDMLGVLGDEIIIAEKKSEVMHTIFWY